MDVSILIVSYNTCELTLECIQSIFDQTHGIQFEIIVVDNCSDDGSVDQIRKGFPQVQVLSATTNLGFAGANNLASKNANGRWLLLLNPDTKVLDGAIQKAVTFGDSQSGESIIGGRTFFGDMRLNANSCHGAPTLWSLICKGTGLSAVARKSRILNPEGLGRWKRDSIREVDCITGCFLLIRRTLWEKLGGFDSNFFMYGEDTDLCIRATQGKARCIVFPDATLIHYGGKSERVRADKMVRLFSAKRQLIEKHWGPLSIRPGIAMLKLWALSRTIALSLIGLFSSNARKSGKQWLEVWKRRHEYCGRVI